jgi:hypothetical protein
MPKPYYMSKVPDSKGRDQLDELIPAIEIPCPKTPVKLFNTFLKLVPVDTLQKLRKNIFP